MQCGGEEGVFNNVGVSASLGMYRAAGVEGLLSLKDVKQVAP